MTFFTIVKKSKEYISVMNTSVTIRDKKIDLQLQQHKINISNDNELFTLITCEPEDAAAELVVQIKTEFKKFCNKEFKVSDASMIIEIWGHVYAEKFAEAIKSFTSIEFIDDLAEKIIHHCEVINIGEPGYDNNRFVWNKLVTFKSIIAKILGKE